MREHFGYVMQDDSHLVELTVRETLTYSALLRLPANLTYNEKLARVEEVLSDLGLRNVANTKVGGGYVRGVSGGERRRVSIGVQLLKDPCNPPLLPAFTSLFNLSNLRFHLFLPAILLLDEPTTGLDAFTANNIVATLSKLAKRNKTVIFTIHQPRSDIFPLLDVIMLLSQGKAVYFGPRESIIDYFSAASFPCDIYSNPLDYYSKPHLYFPALLSQGFKSLAFLSFSLLLLAVDIVSLDKRSETRQWDTTDRLEKLLVHYRQSVICKNVLRAIETAETTVSSCLLSFSSQNLLPRD